MLAPVISSLDEIYCTFFFQVRKSVVAAVVVVAVVFVVAVAVGDTTNSNLKVVGTF